jgi:hypothetical protein
VGLSNVLNGNILLTAGEVTFVTDTTNGTYVVGVDLSAMVASDNIEFRVYTKNGDSGLGTTERIASAVVTKTGAQTQLNIPDLFGPIPAPYSFKLTVKQTATGAGGLKTIHIAVSKF